MSEISGVEFYWRPGCPFCSGLERNLDKAGIALNKHNIWDNPEHAATVRSIADGNETVPTVVVGGVGMVNPSPRELAAHLAANAPHLLPEGFEEPQPSAVGRALGKIFG